MRPFALILAFIVGVTMAAPAQDITSNQLARREVADEVLDEDSVAVAVSEKAGLQPRTLADNIPVTERNPENQKHRLEIDGSRQQTYSIPQRRSNSGMVCTDQMTVGGQLVSKDA
ncbi:hypothetical protein ASPWEDRAFT_179079 [Aspergillus wentii DTO 134E9]|uniref:Uncharacterized protein n=1 Tax=Aspergillus wentii DTO 134E9 TaxID=1073089 RepID=A0A1L9S2E5_ASPWE|nr:uncharacterized protein ASPWEDRAFT_179079 [Aspergillus wentii DTO 134E9]KAI9924384.1 hypothetical protein MW887_007010 [Aspergillus wentii]OJJ41338.1 hypothetical protein ASPWEDRAFT_179079 [Aspergillus wentii DTO 134E9]